MSQQLWQAAKLATVGELTASIAHELNNPLSTVTLPVESLLEQIPRDDPSHSPLRIVDQELDRMAGLVAGLLQFSRRAQAQFSAVDPCEEIGNTLELLKSHLRNRRIQVEKQFLPGTLPVRADRQQLRQLFLNILTNAADAMPQGGTITVCVATSAGDPAGVVVEFADTGVGIAEEDLAKVLDPFYTTKPEGQGTGLGLGICKRIVEEHHGDLEIVSEPGKGTTVRIILPVAGQVVQSRLTL